ncbi:hypothetical protein BVI2075_700024 [Burkholderia vietnamiensis]|nr:hypothetical protein BVI2075_700024 [Burkholderia vietnamiensis]
MQTVPAARAFVRPGPESEVVPQADHRGRRANAGRDRRCRRRQSASRPAQLVTNRHRAQCADVADYAAYRLGDALTRGAACRRRTSTHGPR